MNKKIAFIFSILSFVLFTSVFANDPLKQGSISGKVTESETNQIVEYATVSVFEKVSRKLIGGTITSAEGVFQIKNIPEGLYTVEITFIGFQKTVIDDVEISKTSSSKNLGNVVLSTDAEVLDAVEVVGTKNSIQYDIDKKIVNVGTQFASMSGTAVDILENLPSVSVDGDGNVSLRGSSGFTVLIDGRPSVLDASEALQQIPASTIENIELITNPSAKYDPDGTAGIINIITKKNKLEGVNGVFNVNGGMYGRVGADFLLNFKKKKWNYYIGANYNKRPGPGSYKSERITNSNDTASYVISEGDRERTFEVAGIQGGVEYAISDNDFIKFSGRIGDFKMYGGMDADFYEYQRIGGGENPINENRYISSEYWERGGLYYSANLNYQHKFAKKGHVLDAQVDYGGRDMTESSKNELYQKDSNGNVAETPSSGQRSTEIGPGGRLRAKIDYTLPIGATDKIEAGWQTRLNKSEDVNEVYNYDVATGDYIFAPDFSFTTQYTQTIHSLYGTYAGRIGKFGYQGGLRAEYTGRNINLKGQEEDFPVDQWNIFPTIHLSYNLPKDDQLMLSYSRRIERPRGYYLEPFVTWQDAFNVRRGNPALLPENIDSFDFGYLKNLGDKATVSLDSYYRMTHNKIERVQSVYEEGVILHTYENVGTDYALGLELSLNFQPFTWWTMDIMGNLYDYRVEGELEGESFDRQSLNWSSRFNNTFKLGKGTSIQVNNRYTGETVTAQGRNEGYFMMTAAVKQSLLKRKLSLTVSMNDVLGTARRKSYSEGIGFNNYTEDFRYPHVVTATLTYRLNNFKPSRRGGDGGGMDF
ncbi:TonB-dependent receptor family protein [Flammeovirga kamogawensis]|uniref:TonB-dependent receptor n=1 Tax=Flammeovirga kamogawensis TaxID=373891 RepID=A0ABX8GZX3_9BACT|nr:TonB-dependent receptor family protein [Flammeovirga kamogawensis]MBB6459346.1 outer membrane receptor protein involved in Fe transport [Flammeovirga kamogawensis]QWG08903.1 TonB-dependent receptor [Flammeovirga kamogawensis]TRX67194.1 TonB-dependent receptor [Flammeovirga kamogawensis]